MLYRILEKQFSDGSEFIPQFRDNEDIKFDQYGEPIYKNFYIRENNGSHTLIKYTTINEAQQYINSDRRLNEAPITVIIHPDELPI